MFSEGKLATRATLGKRAWIIPPLVLLGFLVCVRLFSIAFRYNHGGLLALAAAVLGLPALVMLAFAFRQGLKHVRTLASTLKWWHLPWALTVVSALVFRIRGAGAIASEPVDAWAGFRIAVDTTVASILLGRLVLRRTHWVGSMLRGVVGALTVFGLVCLLSTAWSVFPSWTFYKSWEYLVDVALLAAILESLDSVDDCRNLLNWTWALYGLLLLSAWKDVLLWPQQALHDEQVQHGAILGIRLDGVIPAVSSNDVGFFAGILGLLCLARLFPASGERSHKSWYAILLAGSLVTMVLAQTRSAIVGFLFGSFFILVFSKRGKFGAFVTLIAAPVVALSTMGGVIWSFLERGQTQQQLGSMSSRADWWASAWQTYLERPLTGFGAYAAGRFAVLAKLGLGKTSTMHSDYLEVIVGTGIWGMIPFILTLTITWWLLLRYVRDYSSDPRERQLAYEGLAILALLTLRSVFNNVVTWHPPLHFLAIMGYVEFLRRRRRAVVRMPTYQFTDDLVDEPDSQLELVFDADNPAHWHSMNHPAEQGDEARTSVENDGT